MSVTVKRSCNSNVTVRSGSITFNSFVITIDGPRFEEFLNISRQFMMSPETPDRNVRVLEQILTNALVHYGSESDEEADE